MDTTNKNFLLSLVNLDTKLRANDTSVMTDVEVLKTFDMSSDQKLQIFDMIVSIVEDSTGENHELIKTVVNDLDITDKDYICALVDLPTYVDASNLEQVKTALNKILDENLTISDQSREFDFYSRCVYIAIATKDSDLTKKAINKVQSL